MNWSTQFVTEHCWSRIISRTHYFQWKYVWPFAALTDAPFSGDRGAHGLIFWMGM